MIPSTGRRPKPVTTRCFGPERLGAGGNRGIPYRMDMLLSIPQDPADMTKSDPEGFQKKLETVTGFAQKLEEMGIPKTLLSSGLQRGENGFIDIYFVRYEPFRAAQKQPESEEL